MHRLIGAVFALLLIISFGVPAKAGKQLVLTYGEWAPFHSPSLAEGGISQQFYREILDGANIPHTFKYMSWKDAYDEAKSGSAAGSVGWVKTAKREKDFLFSQPVMHTSTVFFYRSETRFDWNELADVKDYRISVASGDVGVELLEGVVDQGDGRLIMAPSYELAMKSLAEGRADLFFCNKTVGLFLLMRNYSEETDIAFHPKSALSDASHLLISRELPDGPQVIERFNKSLKQLKATGRYHEILDEYLSRKCPPAQ